MPVCENCKSKWSWKQTIKKTTTLNPAMACPNCGEKQYQTQSSKIKVSLLTAIVLLPLLFRSFFDIPKVVLLSSIPFLAVIALLLFPLLVKLSSEEEYII